MFTEPVTAESRTRSAGPTSGPRRPLTRPDSAPLQRTQPPYPHPLSRQTDSPILLRTPATTPCSVKSMTRPPHEGPTHSHEERPRQYVPSRDSPLTRQRIGAPPDQKLEQSAPT